MLYVSIILPIYYQHITIVKNIRKLYETKKYNNKLLILILNYNLYGS